jgi:hypothetical protein
MFSGLASGYGLDSICSIRSTAMMSAPSRAILTGDQAPGRGSYQAPFVGIYNGRFDFEWRTGCLRRCLFSH